MSEIIQLIRYKNNERLGSDCLSNQNDLWNSNSSKKRPTYVFIGSFSISDIAIFGYVIDKQHDSLSDLIISFGTAENQKTFYRCMYWNTKYIFICTSIFSKYDSLYSKHVHNMRRLTADTGHSRAALGVGAGGGGEIPRYICQPGYIAGLIYGPQGPRYNGFPL